MIYFLSIASRRKCFVQQLFQGTSGYKRGTVTLTNRVKNPLTSQLQNSILSPTQQCREELSTISGYLGCNALSRSICSSKFIYRHADIADTKKDTSSDSVKIATENLQRLDNLLADAGIASRRKSGEMIREGKVTVNSIKVDQPGLRINASKDLVMVNGQPVSFEANRQLIYIALNKPRGYVCSDTDSKGNQMRAIDLLKPFFDEWAARKKSTPPPRLFNVGRLDVSSCGLIFFTNDGDWANKVAHPSFNLTKEYLIETPTIPTQAQIDTMRKGTYVTGALCVPLLVHAIRGQQGEGRWAVEDRGRGGEGRGDVALADRGRGEGAEEWGREGDTATRAARGGLGERRELRNWIKMVVSEGRKHEVREIARMAGLEIRLLRRTRVGAFRLPKELAIGQFVMMTKEEAEGVIVRGDESRMRTMTSSPASLSLSPDFVSPDFLSSTSSSSTSSSSTSSSSIHAPQGEVEDLFSRDIAARLSPEERGLLASFAPSHKDNDDDDGDDDEEEKEEKGGRRRAEMGKGEEWEEEEEEWEREGGGRRQGGRGGRPGEEGKRENWKRKEERLWSSHASPDPMFSFEAAMNWRQEYERGEREKGLEEDREGTADKREALGNENIQRKGEIKKNNNNYDFWANVDEFHLTPYVGDGKKSFEKRNERQSKDAVFSSIRDEGASVVPRKSHSSLWPSDVSDSHRRDLSAQLTAEEEGARDSLAPAKDPFTGSVMIDFEDKSGIRGRRRGGLVINTDRAEGARGSRTSAIRPHFAKKRFEKYNYRDAYDDSNHEESNKY